MLINSQNPCAVSHSIESSGAIVLASAGEIAALQMSSRKVPPVQHESSEQDWKFTLLLLQ